MNKTFNLQKVFRIFLSIVLIFIITLSFSGCKERKVADKIPEKTNASDLVDNGKEYPLISAFYPCRGYEMLEQTLPGPNQVTVGPQLERMLKDYEGEKVYLDLIVVFSGENPIENIEKFAADIKAEKVSEPESKGTTLIYHVIGTAETVESIKKSQYKGCYVDINWNSDFSKPQEYNESISVATAGLLKNMGEKKELQVLVITVADKYSRYARDAGHNVPSNEGKSPTMDNFNKLKGNKKLSYLEYEELTKEYITKIIRRNNIPEEKIVKLDIRVGLVHSSEEVYNRYLQQGTASFDTLVSGFTAKLTKAEILSLAEDEDVKVIHNDTVISTYTVYKK